MIKMLSALKRFGIRGKYFEIKKIGDFDNATREGYDHINTPAIDFDKTKRKVCKELKQDPCKSCDALDIVDSKNKINFIEFKVLIDNSDIENWIRVLDLPQKIKDSREVLLNIVRNRRFRYPEKIKEFNSYEKNVIISFDLTDNAKNRILILGRYLTVKASIEKQFYENYIEGEKFNNPECIRMHNFDSEYPKYA